MQKQVPTVGRLLVMAIFTLSCFGLLLYLWSAFGGPVPLKPHGYRFHAHFAEATQLAQEADVRISGVNVGKVKQIDLGDDGRTDATIELQDKYAPLPDDSHAILRQKTLLGETYVELTPGTKSAAKIPENGTLATTQVAPTVELDEILRAFDKKTRESFQVWQQDLGAGIDGHGQDFSDALGSLAPFAENTNAVLQVLNSQTRAVSQGIKNTGVVFDALTERDGQLSDWIANSNRLLATTAQRDKEIEGLFRAFPSFIDNSSSALKALAAYAVNTRPLMVQLQPVATQLSRFLVNAKGLSNNFDQFFVGQGQLQKASVKGLPASSRFLTDTRNLLAQLDPFLRNFNPFLRYLSLYKREISALFANDTATLQATDQIGNNRVHYLRLTSPVNPESLAVYPQRLGSSRHNPYFQPGGYNNLKSGLEDFNTNLCGQGGFPTLGPADANMSETLRSNILAFFLNNGVTAAPPCKQQAPFTFSGETSQFPHVRTDPRPSP
jgi:phospholipid/cholesterol/gamma-HCH transport system substrate-binding protein